MKNRFTYILLLAAVCGCVKTEPSVPYTPLVVDGWIDAGGPPVVLLSRSVGPTADLQSETQLMEQASVGFARVTVSDGERTVLLEGRRDDDYFPPYVYTTDEMTGESGKTYTLSVDYPGISARAVTTVPEPVELGALISEVSQRTDTLYTLTAVFRDREETRDYYKFFTRVEGRDKVWNSSFLGLLDDSQYPSGGEITASVSRGFGVLEKYRQPLFRKGETVHVKFCTVDECAYRYWKSYDDVSALARNAFFPVSVNVEGNVHGALGGWTGYGASFSSIVID